MSCLSPEEVSEFPGLIAPTELRGRHQVREEQFLFS